ncbi:MAG: HlyD family type I secretion periplasmic adaptor subunit [Rhizobiaceae bacterium]
MSQELGKIAVKKVPASQAIAGNAEHARMMGQAAQAKSDSADGHWASRVRTSLLGPALFGLIILIAAIAGFGYWAASAPLSGATVATGVVTASGQNFNVQHLEGGIIESILVSEGETVSKGQSLLKLDPTRVQADRDRLTKGLIVMRAKAERLEAERDGADVAFSPKLVAEAKVAGLENELAEQLGERQKRRARYDADGKIIDQQIEALQQQISGIEVQISSARQQIEVINEELEVKQKLVDQKLTRRSEVLVLQRSRSQLEGLLGELVASMGRARSSILLAEERKLRLDAQAAETAATALNDLRQQMTDLQERLIGAENVLSRIVVRAPSDGIVVKIHKNTPGSVVRQGEDLFVILPVGGDLIVEARLDPVDVDSVVVGQEASLRFSSLNARTTPEVAGEVIYVSADRLVDRASNEPYYTARLKIADVLPDDFEKDRIFPGMPVETFIETEDRTFLQYLVKPFTDSFNRAFREG